MKPTLHFSRAEFAAGIGGRLCLGARGPHVVAVETGVVAALSDFDNQRPKAGALSRGLPGAVIKPTRKRDASMGFHPASFLQKQLHQVARRLSRLRGDLEIDLVERRDRLALAGGLDQRIVEGVPLIRG